MTRLIRTVLSQNRFLRFIIAGAINSLFGFAVYSASILLGLPVWGALVVGNLTGIAFNFVTTGGYVFRSLMLVRFPRFATAYLVVYGVNLKLIDWLSTWVPGSIYAQAILTLPMALLSYILMKRFVFPATVTNDSSETRKSGDTIGDTAPRKQ